MAFFHGSVFIYSGFFDETNDESKQQSEYNFLPSKVDETKRQSKNGSIKSTESKSTESKSTDSKSTESKSTPKSGFFKIPKILSSKSR